MSIEIAVVIESSCFTTGSTLSNLPLMAYVECISILADSFFIVM